MKSWNIHEIKTERLDEEDAVFYTLHHVHRFAIFFDRVIKYHNGLEHEYQLELEGTIVAKVSTSHYSDVPGYIVDQLDEMSVEENEDQEVDSEDD